ncbi:squalene--hopene cyclase [Lecanosticta acicola]|uniref:Squalene--hopene cyclase n=1 Tax=Lecanosticta acicola TaxID=111012 RepID=A0AAI8YYA6_9PEZI|nr:squalene--hopene cyclase [Lecanosticta acicola]
MQCNDGGWAAFDADNDRPYLNRNLFSDMDSLCDPSTADIVGQDLQTWSLFLMAAQDTGCAVEMRSLMKEIQVAYRRGIDFVVQRQEPNGAWYGR